LRPTMFLSIGIPGDRVDVNVHPSKHEVRFRDKMLVERGVEEAVRNSLRPLAAAATVGTGHSPTLPGSGVRFDELAQVLRGADARPGSSEAFPTGQPGTLFDFEGEATSGTGVVGNLLQVFNTYMVSLATFSRSSTPTSCSNLRMV